MQTLLAGIELQLQRIAYVLELKQKASMAQRNDDGSSFSELVFCRACGCSVVTLSMKRCPVCQTPLKGKG